jgi:hypothetical protein
MEKCLALFLIGAPNKTAAEAAVSCPEFLLVARPDAKVFSTFAGRRS